MALGDSDIRFATCIDCGKHTRVFEMFSDKALVCPDCYREIVESILEEAEKAKEDHPDASPPADGH